MNSFEGWEAVAERLEKLVKEAESSKDGDRLLDPGQRDSVRVIAQRLRKGGRALLIADEVGMGKTRIATAVIDAVRRTGGRSAIVLPAGLGRQWQDELKFFNPDDQTLLPLRSYESFIMGYGEPGDGAVSEGWQKRRNERLKSRRLQRELPEGNWDKEEILMISHTFARMRFPDGSIRKWNRELLPAIKAQQTGKRRNIRKIGDKAKVVATRRAAEAICFSGELPSLPGPKIAAASSEEYKRAVLPLIGRALGQFDLVVVDEAHKARGEGSSLSRILGPVTWESEDVLRVGLTATPVELDANQWLDTLARIFGKDDAVSEESKNEIQEHLSKIEGPIRAYAKIARRLHAEPLTEDLVAEFKETATRFQAALTPYVIRRNKRSDKELEAFREKYGDYRQKILLSVTAADMGADWLRCFCAAEALSLLPATSGTTKRLRLKLDKGHGLDKLILGSPATTSEEEPDFWTRNVGLSDSQNIYSHPAILAAVKRIECIAQQGRKVLVFGILVQPLRALTQLLDARATLRHLRQGQRWPARQVPKLSYDAMRAAMAQVGWIGMPDSIERVNEQLRHQYDADDRPTARSATIRAEIVNKDEQGNDTAKLVLRTWPDAGGAKGGITSRIAQLFEAIESRLSRNEGEKNAGSRSEWTADFLLEQVEALERELAFDINGEAGDSQETRWRYLQEHLDDFSGREGHFARMLYGETAPQTRRLLQAYFNRAGDRPMVLVAQSQVGREGLNLHKECRTVVLLHAEWNPAVVEQQIGRIDRKDSRWLKDFRTWEDAEKDGGADRVPKIEVVEVEVEGGYDALNWATLRERWLSLRAQLHGDVISHADDERAKIDKQLASRIERIRAAAPSFCPKPRKNA